MNDPVRLSQSHSHATDATPLLMHRVTNGTLTQPGMSASPPTGSPPSAEVEMTEAKASLHRALQHASVRLPHQAILENFVHTNPLQYFESQLEYRTAISVLNQQREAYLSPGERTLRLTGTDPRKREHNAVVDLAAIFLDRGAAKWTSSLRKDGFLFFFARLEGKGWAPWRSYARQVASKILLKLPPPGEQLNTTTIITDTSPQSSNNAATLTIAKDLVHTLAEELLLDHLQQFGIPTSDYESFIMAMLFKMQGWAGMFNRMESHPEEAPTAVAESHCCIVVVPVSLLEFCTVQIIIARSAIESVATHCGAWRKGVVPLQSWLRQLPPHRERMVVQQQTYRTTTVCDISSIAEDSVASDHEHEVRQDRFEQKLINAISAASAHYSHQSCAATEHHPQVQFMTCIDDRMGSFRRQLEQTRRTTEIYVETFGVAGEFGLPIHFQSYCTPIATQKQHAHSSAKVHKKNVWKVDEVEEKNHVGDLARFNHRIKILAKITAILEAASFHPLQSILLLLLAPVYVLRLFLMAYAPVWESQIWGMLLKVEPPLHITDIKCGISTEDAANALALIFQSTGLAKYFSPMVVVLGHGASSVNNPYFAGYNCGACQGKKGGQNARLFARLANDTLVRSYLQEHNGINIPDDTVFIGGEHDTTKDTIVYYDKDYIPSSHTQRFQNVQSLVSLALANNALERCHRFFLANAQTPREALCHVHRRATDYAEMRPELNHATNAGVVVGRRCLTESSFFDRRLFLTSYDPYSDDDNGSLLEKVLETSLKVCSGINLEYLFSTIAVESYGAGTKAPLNLVGNVGMQQGTLGDLRVGLPSQMIDMHIPLRAFFLIDAPADRVKNVLNKHPDLEAMVFNDWVHVAARDPNTGLVSRYIKGMFVPCPLQDVTERKHLTVQSEWKTFQPTWERGLTVRRKEKLVSLLAYFMIILSFLVPYIHLDTTNMMNAHGTYIAACATAISLPILDFSRRYMHGERLFAQTSLLSSLLVLGFNYIAMAASLEDLVEGWCLFGLASAFLIGTYNNRVTVRSNALFAFASYRFADMALLISVAFGSKDSIQSGHYKPGFVAGGLIAAAMFKSSQFPLTALFARSMEGPTPTSALGYAGLSAHVGLVLLSSTVGDWMPFWPARVVIAVVGIITTVHAGVVSNIHADRKGALAYATASTIGILYCIMAAGYVTLALLLALGHSSLRIGQVLRAPNQLFHRRNLVSVLGSPPYPKIISDRNYELYWSFHRFDMDTNLIHVFNRFIEPLDFLHLSGAPTQQQKIKLLAIGLVFAGAPFTPLSVASHALILQLLPEDPFLAVVMMMVFVLLSLMAMRFMQLNVM